MTSSNYISSDPVQQTARLTERLKQTADTHQGMTRLQPHANEREIIEDLNAKINGMIADTPLMLPEPMPPAAAPPENAMARHADGDELTGWLSRPVDETPEPKSRSHVATLCVGTMVLSILAGYGSAQFLNHSLTGDDKQPRNWTANASSAGLQLDWSSADRDDLNLEPSTEPKRVRVEPATGIALPVNDAATSDVAPTDPPSLSNDDARADTHTTEANARTSLAVLSSETETATEPDTAAIETAALASNVDEPPESEALTPPRTTKPAVADADAAQMLARADRLIENGDIAGARLMLRHLAESGHGLAALKLAQVYDADWLASYSRGDIPANRDLALRWYSMAHERGQSGAAERVEALQALDAED